MDSLFYEHEATLIGKVIFPPTKGVVPRQWNHGLLEVAGVLSWWHQEATHFFAPNSGLGLSTRELCVSIAVGTD